MSSFVILLKLDFETATTLRRALTPRGVSSNSSLTAAMFASGAKIKEGYGGVTHPPPTPDFAGHMYTGSLQGKNVEFDMRK